MSPYVDASFWRHLNRGRTGGTVALGLSILILLAQPARAEEAEPELMRIPNLLTSASPSVPVGAQIFANANLLGATAPTGTLTFELHSPADSTCSTPIFTSVVAVTGTSLDSGRWTTTQAGTYRWTSTYSGDSNHSAVGPTPCANGAEAVIVDKVRTVLSVSASQASATTIRDSAVVSGGLNPGGTLTFTLSPPSDIFCSGPPVFTSTVPVDGNGTYLSAVYSPPADGTYRWRVSYSGDANNRGMSMTGCNDERQAIDFNRDATTVVGDFDGDGRTDSAVYRPATGVWFVREADGGTSTKYWGMVGDVPVVADYDGDRRADHAVYRPSTGVWYVSKSSGGSTGVYWGIPGDIPVPADYDGDGKTDHAIFRPSNGAWFVLRSGGGGDARFWGLPGDVPTPGDYDGDKKTDYAVYRPSTGVWYMLRTSAGIVGAYWGAPGDVPVAGDYDGDGKTDYAVFRPSTGQWHFKKSGGSVSSRYWGLSQDIPVPGDYDGDGTTDVAVFRPSTNSWYASPSGGGDIGFAYGASGDQPINVMPAIWLAYFLTR